MDVARADDSRLVRAVVTVEGEILIMAPTGAETGRRNSKINQRLSNWADLDGTGSADAFLWRLLGVDSVEPAAARCACAV